MHTHLSSTSLISPEQKEAQMNICADIIKTIDRDSNFLKRILTTNPYIWRAPVHPSNRKLRSPSWKQSHDDHVLDIQDTVHVDWVPEGQTAIRLTIKMSWLLFMCGWEEKDLNCGRVAHVTNQANAPTHNITYIHQDIFGKAWNSCAGASIVLTLSCSCDLFLFLKVKSCLLYTSRCV